MLLLNGKLISPDTAFIHADIQYPANWLRHASADEKAAIGISEVVEQPRPDERFFWVTDNGDGTFSATPKDLDLKKAELIAQVKVAAGCLLAATDWMVIRASETGKPVSEAVSGYRTLVRDASNAQESSIGSAQDIDSLAALLFEWPKAPWEKANLSNS